MLDWLAAQLPRFDVPGAAVAVVRGDEVVLSDGFGLRDVDEQSAVTPDTAFALASVTKAFTATAVGALVDDGLLDWDAPVRRYLADFELRDPFATERLTVLDMLSHRSGLPRHDLVWYGETGIDRGDAVRRLRFLEPSRDLRTTWQYNNLMYVAAGHLCEVLTGKSWEDVVRERVLHPLGMEATSFSHHEAGATAPVAAPYGEREGEVVRIPYEPGLWLAGPAGSLYSTVQDLVAWLRVNLAGGRYEGAQVLSRSTVRQLHAPHMVMPEVSLFAETRDTGYGLGWFVGTYRGRKLIHHGGNIDGFSSLIAMLPDDGIGVAFMANKETTPLRWVVAYHAFDELLGLDPRPWSDRFDELRQATKSGAREAKNRAVRIPDRPPTRPLAEYAGDYEHRAYGRFSVDVRDDTLVPSFHDIPMRLVHRHFDVFELEVERLEDVQLTATFEHDVDGVVSRLVVPFEPLVAPIVFTRAPDQRLAEPEFLDLLVGEYAMGPISLLIERSRPTELTATVTGQPPLRLVPHRGTTFNLEEVPGSTITFELEDSTVTEVLVQPIGVFRPKPPSP